MLIPSKEIPLDSIFTECTALNVGIRLRIYDTLFPVSVSSVILNLFCND
ncbi:unknown [Prevotella sp. CAG:924]|nr:unknown [Prevotella sp. CAG:924]